jgi:hypothetical protein
MTECGERESMISAIQSLMGDPIRVATMAAQARSVARNEYSVDREAALVNALYAKLATDGAPQ